MTSWHKLLAIAFVWISLIWVVPEYLELMTLLIESKEPNGFLIFLCIGAIVAAPVKATHYIVSYGYGDVDDDDDDESTFFGA